MGSFKQHPFSLHIKLDQVQQAKAKKLNDAGLLATSDYAAKWQLYSDALHSLFTSYGEVFSRTEQLWAEAGFTDSDLASGELGTIGEDDVPATIGDDIPATTGDAAAATGDEDAGDADSASPNPRYHATFRPT